MNQLFKRNITFFAVPLIILFLAGACDKDMSVVLDNSQTGDVGVALLDSFTANTATVQLDNLPTSSTGRLLIGKTSQEQTGSVKSTANFRLSMISYARDIPQEAEFDSIVMKIAKPGRTYIVGDTTKAQTFRVHRLTEDLELKKITGGIQNDALPIYVNRLALYSNQAFAYEPADIGSVTFNPYMGKVDTVRIRLSQSIGEELFNLLKSGDSKTASNENFHNYFKGLAIVPDDNNTTLIQFTDTVDVKINYSYKGNDGTNKTGSKTLSILDKSYESSHIQYDRSETAFKALTPQNSVPTSATAGVTFIQSGTGVVAKISFPSLKEFLQDENISINKADLVVETAPTVLNSLFPYANTASLFVADERGVPVSFINASYGNGIQVTPIIPGTQQGSNGKFVFNMVQYLQNVKLNDAYEGTSLYLTNNDLMDVQKIHTSELFNSLNTTFLATVNGKPQIKLNILYTKFK